MSNINKNNSNNNNNSIVLQKYMAMAGLGSRRKCQELISQKKVKINGHIANLGARVSVKDHVTVNNNKIFLSNNKIYIMMYKPRGYVTTVHDELERKCVLDLINNKITERVYPVGRLDKNSEGILLITNDGNFANIIMHPSNKISKTYRVTVNSEITDIQVNNLLLIKEIDGQKINPPEIKILESSINRSVLEIKISQGLNRQIRKMCELVNLEVTRLKRISIGNLKLGNLKPGTFRNLEQHEINYFLDK